ncbi:MAG: tRNA (guanosine(37)-N1)-methyltransferase TrmD [Ponticaulis sp.]|nr:tRNA (guanosine(37)-N1)-methyltransferase TrmD [Ponticaulis sp.]|tara:strand:- start:2527 stop:3219 length:693 start_codon:yes stop_codon:yes gene_type:complete
MTYKTTILTLFPEAFPGILDTSIIGRARENDIWSLETLDIREFSDHKHRSVDDTPAGGGAGMVLRPDVVASAVDAVEPQGRPLIYLSPRGKPLTQARVRQLSAEPGVILICGRFEGLDERVIEARGIEEVSIGDYILAGGEVAAMVLLEAVVRLLPGVAGNHGSLEDESFESGLLEYPQYTRPRVWEERAIPDVLLSGDHGAVEKWRRKQSEALTKNRRPDLWEAYDDDK